MNIGRRGFLWALLSVGLPACAPPVPYRVSSGGIVSLDWALAETLIVLGHPPVGVVAASDWDRFVIEPRLPSTVADLGLQQELNFELIAGLQPDLILISPFLEHLQPQLTRIAQTWNLSVYSAGATPLSNRMDIAKELALFVGENTHGMAYLLEFSQFLETQRKKIAGLNKRPIVIVSFVDNRHVRIYGGSSLYAEVLDCLGITNGWDKPVGYFGFSTIGIEKLSTLGDVEFIAVEPVPHGISNALESSPIWQNLPFIKTNHWGTLEPVFMYGGVPSANRMVRLLSTYLESKWV